MPFYFSIFEGRYTPSRYYDVNVNSSVSYKHYAGNNKIDKSAYVIHSTSSLNFYQFLGGAHNSDIRYSPTKLHMEYQRTPYANYAPKDEHYGHVFYGSRQNKWDGRGEISGSWACDDKFGK
ncbi:MAG: hypothetical protein LBT75_02940 [Bacilli bacterium]|nr:hypothetical protein [Bacilli bacterium]